MAIKKILIVDDSPTERYFLSEIFIKAGYVVTQAESGEDALVKIKADLPHLVLMDVVMPGQNGYQVTRAISKDPATANIPVIMCTTKNQETDKVWGIRQGAREYVVKPVSPEDLLSKIRALPESQL